jgi:general L-amino acid transport system substrate-binding protein
LSKIRIAALAAVSLAAAAPPARAGAVLDRVRAAHALRCGVVGETADWNKVDLHGNLSALGAALCKAVAVSILGRPDAANISRFNVEGEALHAMRQGSLDVVMGATPSPGARALNGTHFGAVIFYDPVQVMVRAGSGIERLEDLAGKKVCAIDGADTEGLISWTLSHRNIRYIAFSFQEEGEMESGLLTGHCQALVATLSKLGEIRQQYRGKPDDMPILPDRLTMLPISAAAPDGDAAFSAVVDWTIYALQQAEILGVTRANIGGGHDDGDILMERLIGVDAQPARDLGLAPTWAVGLIGSLGNYGEIYQRTVGAGSPMQLPRGANAPWTAGGLIVPWPLE